MHKSNLVAVGTLLALVAGILYLSGREKGSPDENDLIFADSPSGPLLRIPRTALPAGISKKDISISTSGAEDLSFSIADSEVTVFHLLPDGTEFSESIIFEYPFHEMVPVFFHAHGNESEYVRGVEYRFLADRNVSRVPLEHFSDLVVFKRASNTLGVKGLAQNTLVGENVVAELRIDLSAFWEQEFAGGKTVVWRLVPGSVDVRGNVTGSSGNVSGTEQISEKGFGTQATIESRGIACDDIGKATMSLNLTVQWQQAVKSDDGDNADIVPGSDSFTVELPFECLNRKLLTVQQDSMVVMTGAEASSNDGDEWHQDSFTRRSDWNAFTGESAHTLRMVDGEQVDFEEQPVRTKDHATISHESSVQSGAKSYAMLSTTTIDNLNSLTIAGHVELSTQVKGNTDWHSTAAGNVAWTSGISIHRPAYVHVTNCLLFNQAAFSGQLAFKKSGRDCSFRVNANSSEFVISGIDTVPGMNQKLPDRDSLDADAKRLMDTVAGQQLVFSLNLLKMDTPYMAESPDIEESFKILIMEDGDDSALIEGIAADEDDCREYAVETIRERVTSRPSFIAPTAFVLSRGETFKVLEVSSSWAQIATGDGRIGYMHKRAFNLPDVELSSNPGSNEPTPPHPDDGVEMGCGPHLIACTCTWRG